MPTLQEFLDKFKNNNFGASGQWTPQQTPKVTAPSSPAPQNIASPSLNNMVSNSAKPTSGRVAINVPGFGVEGFTTPNGSGNSVGGVTVTGNTFKSINPSKLTIGVDTPSLMQNNNQMTDQKPVENPYDKKASELMGLLLDASKTAMSEGNLLKRKYDIMGVRAIQDALSGVAPMTSFGNFGVAGMNNEIAGGKLGIEQGNLALNQKKAGTEALESAAKTEYYKANALESKAKSKALETVVKPDPFDVQAQKSWLSGLDSYLKNEMVLGDIMAASEDERDAVIASHQQLYRKLNPPVPIRKVNNPDGTITVTFADGSTQKMKKKGAQ